MSLIGFDRSAFDFRPFQKGGLEPGAEGSGRRVVGVVRVQT